jgi:hypothetical protein
MELTAPHATQALANTSGDSWQVSVKHGTVSGVGAQVTGSGAWAKVTGSMNFTLQSLESSSAYKSLQKSEGFSAGISAFWGWLGISGNYSKNQSEVDTTFHQITQSQSVTGEVDIDLEVSGQYPGVQVSASAYVLVMQVTDKSGSTITFASSGDPSSDTGAQDQNGNTLPTKNNKSTITLS